MKYGATGIAFMNKEYVHHHQIELKNVK
jgi:hypothetical protein